MNDRLSIRGMLVDVHVQKIYPAEVIIEKERIISIEEVDENSVPPHFILPGFIDSHVHIESSMLIPSEFARLAVVHGTVATVSDPHEIANVCGMQGVEYMIENGRTVPFKFNFGAPSCVPATGFETAGAVINATHIDELLRREEILYLSEMMNFPGVLNGDAEVMQKILTAQKYKKPVDGHAPGLVGEQAEKYIDAGISTDHECFTKEEALDKLKFGMKIIIREGSAARNFDALAGLLHDHADMMMFCSDDKHPDSLVEGHISQLCARAVAMEIDIFKVLKAACVNPVNHYKLKVGLLRKNDFADLILVKDLRSFKVLATYINGQLVAENGNSLLTKHQAGTVNNFHSPAIELKSIIFPKGNSSQVPVIEALDGQLITNKIFTDASSLVAGEELRSNTDLDLLKIVVVNRYSASKPSTGFIKNFGLKRGAIASSVAHDSHNIVAVGADDESLVKAINLVIAKKGGISCVDGEKEMILPLPVAGLMSNEDGYKIATQYSEMDKAAKNLGSTLSAPYMTLSFMALLVIPHLKMSDLGLFDGDAFKLIT